MPIAIGVNAIRLRTLEFWIDNLNPEFLFPVLSRQQDVFSSLMLVLSEHLKPAPYPYGLLTLRLLGKLGGKNRRFLHDPIDVPAHASARIADVGIRFNWVASTSDSTDPQSSNAIDFIVKMPLESCIRALQTVLLCQGRDPYYPTATTKKGNGKTLSSGTDMSKMEPIDDELFKLSWDNASDLFRSDPERLDLAFYCDTVVDRTLCDQASAAITVLKAAFRHVVAGDGTVPPSDGLDMTLQNGTSSDKKTMNDDFDPATTNTALLSAISPITKDRNASLQTIFKGFVLSLGIPFVRDEAKQYVDALLLYLLDATDMLRDNMRRVDANGTVLSGFNTKTTTVTEGPGSGTTTPKPQDEKEFSSSRQSSLMPFGYFHFVGLPDHHVADPLVFLDAFVEVLVEASDEMHPIVLESLDFLLDKIQQRCGPDFCKEVSLRNPLSLRQTITNGCEVVAEKLLASLCHAASSCPWNRAGGLHKAIHNVLRSLGRPWALCFEVEIVETAISEVKKAPREIPLAGVKAIKFFADVMTLLYDQPFSVASLGAIDPNGNPTKRVILKDMLSLEEDKTVPSSSSPPPPPPNPVEPTDVGKQQAGAAGGGGESNSAVPMDTGSANSETIRGTTTNTTKAGKALVSNKRSPSQRVVQILITELASTMQLARSVWCFSIMAWFVVSSRVLFCCLGF